jgi:hypothetical protein
MDLKIASQKNHLFVLCITVVGGLWAASQWWEKALAERINIPIISPNGCYRLQTLKPFWVLPSIFQPFPDPNEGVPSLWFITWGYPGFYRLYNNHTNELVGESDIYDLEYAGGRLLWNERTGTVFIGMISITPKIMDCTISTSNSSYLPKN